jgi:hypothetical protein
VRPHRDHQAVAAAPGHGGEGGFTHDAFTVEETSGTVTCPNQITRLITGTRPVIFGAAGRGCPLRPRCTSSTRGHTLNLHPHDALQRAHRLRARTPEFQTVYRRHRRMVERSISWLVAGRNRRLRFRADCGSAEPRPTTCGDTTASPG